MPGTTILSAAVNDDFSDIAAALTGSVAADGQTTMTGALKAAAGSAANPGITFTGDTGTGFYQSIVGSIEAALSGVATFFFSAVQGGAIRNNAGAFLTMYPGMIMDFAGATAPTGWLLCAGQQVSQTTYAALFAIVGTTYNTGGESAGNFRLPDYRGRTGYGVDNMGGSAANRITNAVSGIVGTTQGATGGNQGLGLNAFGLHQSDLPNATLTFIGTPPGNAGLNSSGILQWSGAGSFNASTEFTVSGSGTRAPSATSPGSFNQINPNTTIPTPAGTISSINGGVSQTVPPVMNPAIMVNKIIYAGA